MVKPSNNYNPESYGSNFQLIPEGVHKFIIEDAEETTGQYGTQWQVDAHPVDQKYKSNYAKRVWLKVDGVINALYDAMGIDPRSVQDREYSPNEFIGKTIYGVIAHRTKDDKTRDNLVKLHPAFSEGMEALPQQQQPTPQERESYEPGNEPYNIDHNDEPPF